ncbi:putative translational initiation factor (plasmid) [Methylobacterium nodulans ORS 2060]|uniref:Putative translational initiation factor n=1 Tax=Methylobacterium nodulans (strain LMG 21967 / CNCM I-2342 / ORS 2060) TaxID=460265 RepID=B8IXT0_METNO|nr:putative translational initiation factor [Methylobacterium nodulans ORS 2060]
MRMISALTVMLGTVGLMGVLAHAAPVPSVSRGGLATPAGSSDGAGFPGLPGGRGGAPGRIGTPSRSPTPSDPAELRQYCVALLKGTAAEVPSLYHPEDCATLFGTAAEPGQPGRGGNGAGLPGLPGGRGGRSGVIAPSASGVSDPLAGYCQDLLTHPGQAVPPGDMTLSDCQEYLTGLDPTTSRRAVNGSKKSGADGPSLSGGIGGRGGLAGAGPGGGSGGAGGAGIGGGVGGRGGPGGSGY